MLCPRTSTDQKKKHQYIGTIGSFRLWCTSPCCCRTLSPFPSWTTAGAPNIGPFSDRRRRNPRCSLLQFTGGSCWRWWTSLLHFSGCHSSGHFSCPSFWLPRSDTKQKHNTYLTTSLILDGRHLRRGPRPAHLQWQLRPLLPKQLALRVQGDEELSKSKKARRISCLQPVFACCCP